MPGEITNIMPTIACSSLSGKEKSAVIILAAATLFALFVGILALALQYGLTVQTPLILRAIGAAGLLSGALFVIILATVLYFVIQRRSPLEQNTSGDTDLGKGGEEKPDSTVILDTHQACSTEKSEECHESDEEEELDPGESNPSKVDLSDTRNELYTLVTENNAKDLNNTSDNESYRIPNKEKRESTDLGGNKTLNPEPLLSHFDGDLAKSKEIVFNSLFHRHEAFDYACNTLQPKEACICHIFERGRSSYVLFWKLENDAIGFYTKYKHSFEKSCIGHQADVPKELISATPSNGTYEDCKTIFNNYIARLQGGIQLKEKRR